MCGVVAIVRSGGLRDDERGPLLERMRDALAHRGPDDATAAVLDDWVALGHRRLSIIDQSGSRQPLVNEIGTIACVFNGEIYNFVELRTRLEALGHRFATRGDGEVIVHGYEQWGDEIATHLEGMFAFVLVDRVRRRVVAARDRFGIKPLFWTETGGAVLIASELKALLAHPAVPRVANRLALNVGLMRMHVPWPLTAFAGIHRLPPGALITVGPDGQPALARYAPMLTATRHRPRPRAQLLEETVAELERAVARQMIADVPVGAFLSGGIDSTLIVALMTRLANRPIHTFSVSTGPGDEANAARATAARLGTCHHTVALHTLPFDELTLLAALYDEPFAETSALGVTVATKSSAATTPIATSATWLA
jgi:asparagine synthase (glutamine-hydrolysing)